MKDSRPVRPDRHVQDSRLLLWMVALASAFYLALTGIALLGNSLSTFLCEFADDTGCDRSWTASTVAAGLLWVFAGGALVRAAVAALEHGRSGGLAKASGFSLGVAFVCVVAALLLVAVTT